MSKWTKASLALAFGLSVGVSQSEAQVVTRERDVTVTGPRGRSIERSVQSERGPGFVDRQVNIKRPGGTYSSDVRVQRGLAAPARGFVPGPRGFVPGGWGRPAFVERDVIVRGGGGVPLLPALAVGGGLFGLGMLAGSAVNSAPPAVVAVPAQPPAVYYNAPQPYSPTPPPPATVVVDPVADAVGRLKSYHDHSRRDGAYVLGRLRDPRAVPALVDRLKNDWAKEVRVAAATALGDIGDPQALVPLERATVYDKRQEVRDAAAGSISRIQQAQAQAQAQAQSQAQAAVPAANGVPSQAGATIPNLESPERVPPPPSPAPRAN